MSAPLARFFRHWRAIGGAARLYLAHIALLTAGQAVIELFFNLAIRQFGYSLADLGQVATAAVAASAALSLPLWWLASRMGLRTALLLNGALQACATAAYAFAPSLGWLLAASALSGGSAVLLQVSAAPLMMRHSDAATRDTLFSANSAIGIGVAGLASLLAGPLPGLLGAALGAGASSATSYRAAFLVAAAGTLLACVPLLPWWPAWREAAPRPPDPPSAGEATPGALDQPGPLALLGALWRDAPAILALAISPALISVGAALLVPYFNLFFRSTFGASDAALGLIFALMNVATGAAVLAGPLFSERYGKVATIVLGQALSLPFLLLMGFAPSLGVAVGAAMLRGGLINMAQPLYHAFAMERTREALRPTVIGIIGGASTVGYLFAPSVSTWVQASYGFGPLFLATGGCYLLATLATAALFLRRGRAVVQ